MFSEVYRWSGFRVPVRSPHRLRGGEQCESPSSTRPCSSGSSCDLEATVWRYQDDYGIGPWEFAQIDLGEANNYREYGEPVERSTRIAIATVGRVMWELIEPLDEEGIYMPVSLLRKVRVFTQVRVRNCPKRGLSNAPSMNLAAIRSTKWAKRNLSAPFGATLRTHLRLFGRFLISTLAIYQRKG